MLCACGMFCTSASADSVTGTPALAIRSWKPSLSPGAMFPIVPANPCNLLLVSSVWPCSATWNLSFDCCCSIWDLNSSLWAPVSLASLSSSSAKFIALFTLCWSVNWFATPVLLCESKFSSSVSFISSTVNPNGASLSIPNSLVTRPSVAISFAPAVVLPNSAAKLLELLATSFAKSSSGSAASPAANLRSTMDLPKFAPDCDSCLNVSMLTSSLLPRIPRPLTLSVNALIDPCPSNAALPSPTKDFPTFLVISLNFSLVSICFSLVLICSPITLYSFSSSLYWFCAIRRALISRSSLCLVFLLNSLEFVIASLACSAAVLLDAAVPPPVDLAPPLSLISSRSFIICSIVAIRLLKLPFYTHINIDI